MISCDLCKKEFANGSLFERHMRRKIPCFTCTPTSSNEVDAPIKTGEYTCVECHKVLSNKYSLKIHMKTCKGCNVLQCPVCRKTFSSASSKCQHIKKENCKPPEPQHNGGTNTSNVNNIQTQQNANTINNNNNSFVINWSSENYDHMSAQKLVEVIKKCIDAPSRFFSEFPRVAHTGEHKNLKMTNVKANYADVYEDGKYIKMTTKSVLEDCAKKMIYRLDDAYMENEGVFKQYERMTKAIVEMEAVINETATGELSHAVIESLRVLDLKAQTARSTMLHELRMGLRNV